MAVFSVPTAISSFPTPISSGSSNGSASSRMLMMAMSTLSASAVRSFLSAESSLSIRIFSFVNDIVFDDVG